MTAEIETLILAQLRDMRPEMAAMRGEIAAERQDLVHVVAKIDGVSLLPTMLAGHVHGLEGRTEFLETRR